MTLIWFFCIVRSCLGGGHFLPSPWPHACPLTLGGRLHRAAYPALPVPLSRFVVGSLVPLRGRWGLLPPHGRRNRWAPLARALAGERGRGGGKRQGGRG